MDALNKDEKDNAAHLPNGEFVRVLPRFTSLGEDKQRGIQSKTGVTEFLGSHTKPHAGFVAA